MLISEIVVKLIIIMMNTHSVLCDICDLESIDGAFNNENNEIQVTKDRWIWTANKNKREKNTLNVKNKILINLKSCEQSACKQFATQLLVTIYNDTDNSYKLYEIKNGAINHTIDISRNPFDSNHLSAYGNIRDENDLLWTKHWKKSDNVLKAIAFEPNSGEVIAAINIQSNKSIISWKKLVYDKNGSKLISSADWNQMQLKGSYWSFVGMFIRSNKLFVMGVHGKNETKVFKLSSTHELLDTKQDFKQFFGCEAFGLLRYIVMLIALIGVILLCLITLIAIIAGCWYVRNKNRDSKSRSQSSSQSVKQPKIGDINSKIDMVTKISELSIGSKEYDRKYRRKASKRKNKKSDPFEFKKRRKKF